MESKIVLFTIGTWFLFMIAAILNAAAREGVYKSIIGELRAHQLSTIIFISIILLLTYLILRTAGIQLTDQQALLIGGVWLIMTICFEFLAGHFIFGNTWEKLFHDYNVLNGRIWSLVLLITFLAPYLTNKIS